jgi:hypothetical protein
VLEGVIEVSNKKRKGRKGICRKCGERKHTNSDDVCFICLGKAAYCEKHKRQYPKNENCPDCLGLENGTLREIDGQIISSNDPRIEIVIDSFEFMDLQRCTADFQLKKPK